MSNGDLRRQIPSLCLLQVFPSFIHWAWCPMVWDVPLVSRSQLSHLCPFLAFCAPPASSGVMWAAEKALTLCEQSSAITITSLLSAIFTAQIQNSPIVTSVKKINSASAKTSTHLQHILSSLCSWLSLRFCKCFFLTLNSIFLFIPYAEQQSEINIQDLFVLCIGIWKVLLITHAQYLRFAFYFLHFVLFKDKKSAAMWLSDQNEGYP